MAKNEDFETSTGKGGETHQHVPKKGPHSKPDAHLTTNQGIRVSDNQNSLRAGARGPTLLEDFVLREKIFHFDHERISERIVHARGSAAHGYFENYKSLADITKADLFQRAGEKTPLFTRISTVAGGAGSVDTPRDVRGFAVKFYTKEGNWDLVGNNIPVFFIQDAIKFPDLVHAVKMESDRAFASRFEDDRRGTNPEEILGAAHAACFTMAFSFACDKAGLASSNVDTQASVRLAKQGEGFVIDRIALTMQATVPGIDEAKFQEIANAVKRDCPVSQALASVPEITLKAKLR